MADIPMRDRRFLMRDLDGNVVMGGALSGDNVYIVTYGAYVAAGDQSVQDLQVGESTQKRYGLSGQRLTTYRIERVA